MIIFCKISQEMHISSEIERKSREHAPAPIKNSQWSERTKRPSKFRFHKPRFTHQSSNDGNELKAFSSRVQGGSATLMHSDSREDENKDGRTVKESRRQPVEVREDEGERKWPREKDEKTAAK